MTGAEDAESGEAEAPDGGDERAGDRTLRPRRLADFPGQERVKDVLGIAIEAAAARGEPLDHHLFYGPPGLGKTTLAHILAAELEAPIRTTSGPAVERPGDLAAILTNLKEGEVLFVDEVHRLSRAVEEILYPAMEDFAIDLVIGKGPGARSIRLALPPFTLIGATTRYAMISAPLRDRFGSIYRLDFYDEEALTAIVRRSAALLGMELAAEAAVEIARRSRGTPRVANRILRRVRDYAEVRAGGPATLAATRAAIDLLEVDALGLDEIDRRLLRSLVEQFGGGPAGLETIAAAISEEPDTVVDVYEPFLLTRGLLRRTPRGRVATPAAWRHLGLEAPPGAQGDLWREGAPPRRWPPMAEPRPVDGGGSASAFARTVLPNGLRVVTSAMPRTRSATVSVYVGAGSRHEADAEAGLSHFLEHMLFKGASRRPTARAISEAIESTGGLHNAVTDRELTVFYAKTPDWAAGEAIDILADMVSAPVLDAGELEKERAVILEELAGVEDSPGELAAILADETLWPGQPLGRNIGGTAETARKLPREAVARYFRDRYAPANMALAVAGNVEHEAVAEAAARWLGDLPAGQPDGGEAARPRGDHARVAVRAKDTEQAHLCLSWPAPPAAHPDQYAAALLSALLAEGMSSRLFLELREERALVYDVHSWVSEYRDAGSFTVYAACDPARARLTLEAALEAIARFPRDVADDELARGKRLTAGRLQLRMEDTRAVSAWIGGQELLLDEVLGVDEVTARIEAVTLDDLRRLGAELPHPDAATLAAVGPFDGPAPFDGLF